MEMATLASLTVVINGAISIIKDLATGAIRTKEKLREETNELLNAFPQANAIFQELVGFFHSVTIEASNIHILSNKISELIASKENIFKGRNKEKQDTQWQLIAVELNYLGISVKELESIARKKVPLLSSNEIGEILTLIKQVVLKYNGAQTNQISKDIDQLKNTVSNISILGNEIKSLATSYVNQLTSAYALK